MKVLSWKRIIAITGSASVVAALLAGCGTSENTSTTAANSSSKEGGSIIIDANGSVKDLDPALSYDGESNEIVEQVYDRLVTYQGSGSEITAMAASSWEISPDGKTYTFHLRPGMKFSNGDSVTAQSFIDEFERVLSSKVNSPGEGFIDPIIEGSTAYHDGKATSVSGLSSINANTLKITLTEPQPFFLNVLAMPFFSAIDLKYISQVGSAAFDSKDAMGSGAFELASVTPNQYVLKKNPNYWLKDSSGNRLPYLNQITIRINSNSELDALNFQSGQTAFIGNAMNGIPSSAWPQFETNPSLKSTVMTLPANETGYIGMNSSIKPFNNILVRQAVEYAVNKQQIAKLMDNRVQIANQPLPPGIKGYMKDLPADASYSLDIAKAKQLLAKVGFQHGFSTTYYTPNDTDSMKIADAIQYDLAQVGIKITIIPEAFSTYLDNTEKGNVSPIFLGLWMQDFPDASDFLNTLFNSNEIPQNDTTMYSNPQVDEWLNQAQTDTNPTERNTLYDEVTDQVMKDASWDPLYYATFQFAVQSWVHGFYINQTLLDPLQYVWIDPSHR